MHVRGGVRVSVCTIPENQIHAIRHQTFEPFKMVVILNYLTLIWRDPVLIRLTVNGVIKLFLSTAIAAA